MTRRIRRVRDPWWHWPAAVLLVVGFGAATIGLIVGLAHLLKITLEPLIEKHPEVYVYMLLGFGAIAISVNIIATAGRMVNDWRRK